MFLSSGLYLMNEKAVEARSFSERLRQLRMQKGLSQKAFAESVDIHPVHYNRYEKGAILPSTDAIGKIAEALGVSMDYLLEGNVQNAAVANIEDKELLKIFERLEKLPKEQKDHIKDVLDGYLMKKELQQKFAS